MTRQLATFIHVLFIAVQFGNALGKVLPLLGLPAEWQSYAAIVLAAGQTALGWLQHNFNPDGTPAAIAFTPGVK